VTPAEEKAWAEGRRSAFRSLLGECARELGGEDRKLAAVLAEVEASRVALRQLCADHGDLEWDDRLHLADVIEKHLARHLDEDRPPLVHALTGSELIGNTRCGDGPESSAKLDDITCPRCWRKLWEQAVNALEAT